MTDYRKPYHDERLAPCPICGGEPWADSRNGTIYCDCGLRYHINGECHPEWHRMDWTAAEWNRLASVRAENDALNNFIGDVAERCGTNACPSLIDYVKQLRELVQDYDRVLASMHALCDCDFVPLNDATLLALRSRMHELGIEAE